MADEESRRRERVARALANPVYFGEIYVRPFDEAWSETLPEFAHDMAAFALRVRRGVVILPPEFLKTTLLSQVIPLWLTYRYAWAQKLLRGMLLAEEEGMSSRNLSVLSWHIENNGQLNSDFADDRGKPLVYPDPEENTWREDAIIVARRGASKDPTWQAKGLDSKGIQGRRLDWLIGDDIITPKNAFSGAMRRQALNLWDMQITTRLVRDGRALVAGNFNHERDLVSTLAARKSYEVFRRPAIHKPGQPSERGDVDDPGDELLWPQNWDRERLRAERDDKPQRYRRIYLLDPRAERGDKLKLEWLNQIDPRDTDLEEAMFVMAVDPAPGGEQNDLDYFNVSVGALADDHFDLCASIDVRRPMPEQMQLVGAIHDRFQRLGYGVVAIGGAKVAMDRYMRGALIAIRPDLDHKLREISVPGNKEHRIEADLSTHSKSGWMRFWRPVVEELTSDPHDQHQELSFREQWTDFPNGKHDDKIDTASLLVRTALEHGQVEDVELELEAA